MLSGLDPETERVRSIFDRLAPRYDRIVRIAETVMFAGGRSWACSQAQGDVLEVAVGTGRNFAYYPPTVRLTGVDVSDAMLEIARRQARSLGRTVTLLPGDAQQLPFPDAAFDAVVFTLALCCIPDDGAAIAEAGRVLRAGGQLLFLEHGRSTVRAVRAVQGLIEPWSIRLEGDHQLRDPLDHLVDHGFEVEHLERRRLGIVVRARARKRPH
jgi:ubiquinone/menaquinone biosynthesis C-methylase UbiE